MKLRNQKSNRQNTKPPNGFSLLEVLIVMAIVGILTATTLPKFSGLITKTKETSVKAIAHSIELAIESHKSIYQSVPDAQSIETLLVALQTKGILTTPLQNPFTHEPFQAADTSGKIEVNCDTSNQSYTVKAYSKKNTTILLEINSP